MGCDDIVSSVAFVNIIKEFIPDFHVYVQHLRPYTKKGASFKSYAEDKAAQEAFSALRQSLYTDAVLVAPDYTAAAN